ncbi:metacaspase-3-like isoform X2 [Macadamia integrifolia]|uniref:metacaspase-3-like isoform X2 n=1 Tax=Macadamia integrifolia TaxID=60698 RepID=UPI001C4F629F|nr:metacaspase-3-like isoform X2 [Macadamia integrifolia]
MRPSKMEGRRVSCRGCGMQLTVPPETQAIRCYRCGSTICLRPVPEPVTYAGEWIKEFLTNVSNTAINYVATSSLNNNPSLPGGVMSYNGYNYPPLPPSPPLSAPAISYSSSVARRGRKKALLCGVSYKGKRFELKGSINDVNCMRYFLVQRMGFPNESVLVLTEDEPNPDQIPTKRNIQKALQWLIHDCKPGDSLVFHYSGHGSQQPNLNGDEIDGYDETLCPLDYQTAGMIIDDEINAAIVKPLPRGATLHAIIDACHSGTVLDLPFVCKINRDGSHWWQDQSCPSGVYKGASGGLVLCFSACDDSQTSADTNAFSSGNLMQGAMTYSFIRAVDHIPGLTYGHLLNAMRSAIREGNSAGRFNGPIASLLKKLFRTQLSQEPQLSSSEQFDIFQKRFVL